MKEENVYEETTRTEETVAVSEQGAGRKSAENMNSTVLGKFKDVDALVRAYGSLQAEFTRRSQRLKELEKILENSEKGELGEAYSGAEKLRKNALARKAETKRFDEFMASTVRVNAQETKENTQDSESENLEDEPSKTTALKEKNEDDGCTVYELNPLTQEERLVEDEGDGRVNGLEKAECVKGERAQNSVATSGNANDLSKDLYEQASRDEKVRLKIIGEYLSSLGKSNAPLMTGGVGVFAAPPKKPTSISAAGDMALLYFKKSKA